MNRWYLITTVMMLLALTGWLVLEQRLAVGPGRAHAADAEKPPAEPAPQTSGHSLPEVIGLIALLVIPLAFMVVIARLQQRRRKAYKEARKQQRDEARAAEMADREGEPLS